MLRKALSVVLSLLLVSDLVPIQTYAYAAEALGGECQAISEVEEGGEGSEESREVLVNDKLGMSENDLGDDQQPPLDSRDTGEEQEFEEAEEELLLKVQSSSGSCGDDATYVLDDDGTLTISGTGAISEEAFKNNANIKRSRRWSSPTA